MWNTEAEKCHACYSGEDYCSSFQNLKGWGCRLLRIVPSTIPTTEMERAKLFSMVYSEAEKLGVTMCPKFRHLGIDEALENTEQLRIIARCGDTCCGSFVVPSTNTND